MKKPIQIPVDAPSGVELFAFDLNVTPEEASALLDATFDSLYYDHEDN